MSEYYKQYYQERKEEILEKCKQKITCECGSIVRKTAIVRHTRSTKHIQYLQSQENNSIEIIFESDSE